MTSWVFSTVRLRNGAADRTHAMQARSTVGRRRFPRPVGVALFRAGRLVMSVMAAQMTVLRPTRPTSEQLTVINKHKPGSSSYRVPPAAAKPPRSCTGRVPRPILAAAPSGRRYR